MKKFLSWMKYFRYRVAEINHHGGNATLKNYAKSSIPNLVRSNAIRNDKHIEKWMVSDPYPSMETVSDF